MPPRGRRGEPWRSRLPPATYRAGNSAASPTSAICRRIPEPSHIHTGSMSGMADSTPAARVRCIDKPPVNRQTLWLRGECFVTVRAAVWHETPLPPKLVYDRLGVVIFAKSYRGDPVKSGEKRRAFFLALIRQFRVVWPILSGVLVVMVGLGLVIGRIEDWRIADTSTSRSLLASLSVMA